MDDDLTRFAQLLDGAAHDEEPGARRRRRRGWIATALVLVVLLGLAGGYATYALTAPVAFPVGTTRVPKPPTPAPAVLALPADTTAMVSVEGGEDFIGPDGLSAASGEAGPVPMASISKLVTALVVLDAFPLAGPDDPGPTLTFGPSDHALYDKYYVLGATISEMPVGSTMSLRDALQLMLVVSASNYAEAVAGWAFGSQSAFLRATADWLDRHGLTQTVLVEPTGIDARNVSTAAELIAIGKLAMADEAVARIVAMPSLDVPGFTGSNTNSLIGTSGVRGIKTGTLDGSNLLYSSLLDVGIGEPLVITGVELGGRDRRAVNTHVEALLASIHDGFRYVRVGTKGEVFGSYTAMWGAEARMVLGANAAVKTWSDTPITASLTTTEPLTGRAGEEVGSITWTAGARTVTAPLVLDRDIEPPDEWWRLTHPFDLGG